MVTESKFKASVLTALSAVVNAGLVIVFNLIYSNLLITHYGSAVYGLIATLIQFVSMFSIIEGGFSTAAVVASYEPIVKKDYEKLNSVIYSTYRFLLGLAIIFTLITLITGIIYIIFLDSPIEFLATFFLLLITIISSALSLGVLPKYTIVLQGYNKKYVVTLLFALSKTITWVLSIIFILCNDNILLVYSTHLLNILINIIFLKKYEKKHFTFLTYKGNYNKELIRGTKDVFYQKIAATVFSSTDLILISIGIDLTMASIYNVYNMIFQSFYSFLTAITEGPSNSFGQMVSSGEKEKAFHFFEIFQKSVMLISSIIITAIGMSVISFLSIYSKNIKDADYMMPSLVVLFFCYYFLKVNNTPFGQFINVSGQFALQNKQCGLAAIINLIVSVFMMFIWGIQGVVFGSVCGTALIIFMNVYRCYNSIFEKSSIKGNFYIIMNLGTGLALIYMSLVLNIRVTNYIVWFFLGAFNLIISCIVFIILNLLIDKKTTIGAIDYYMSKLLKKNFTKTNL